MNNKFRVALLVLLALGFSVVLAGLVSGHTIDLLEPKGVVAEVNLVSWLQRHY